MREEDVLGVLSEDIVEFADIMEALRNQGFRVLHFSDDGIVIAEGPSQKAAVFCCPSKSYINSCNKMN